MGMLKRLRACFSSEKGAVEDLVVLCLFVAFVLFPVASAMLDRYAAILECQEIKDALDITNIAVYDSLRAQDTGKTVAGFDSAGAMELYKSILARNLRLNGDLTPGPGSIAEGPVSIDELALYTSGFPCRCPQGQLLSRPAIHTYVTVPVRPSLYRGVILGMMGKQYVELKVHVDTDLPVDK